MESDRDRQRDGLRHSKRDGSRNKNHVGIKIEAETGNKHRDEKKTQKTESHAENMRGRQQSTNTALVVASSMTDGNHLMGKLILEYNDSAVWRCLISFIVTPIQRQLLPGVGADKVLVFLRVHVYMRMSRDV